jgi:hypothetical protein
MMEHLNSEQWSKARLGALLCFAVACALLAASLLTPPPDHSRMTTGAILQAR